MNPYRTAAQVLDTEGAILLPSPQLLDAQCQIQLDGWVDLDSERWREVDNDPNITKKFLKTLMNENPPYLFTDALGRVWGKGSNGVFYPFHIEYGKKKYGIRIPKRAAN